MNLDELVRLGPNQFSDDQLAGMSHGDLMLWRKTAERAGDKNTTARLAPFEHQAFAREYTTEHPISGTLGLSAAIPLYQLAKSAGFDPTATPASLKQLTSGFRGIGQGLGVINSPNQPTR